MRVLTKQAKYDLRADFFVPAHPIAPNTEKLGILLLDEHRKQVLWIDLEHPRDFDEFDHIHAPLARLDASHERVRALQERSEIPLREARLVSHRDQKIDQGAVTFAAQGLPQSRSGHGARTLKIAAPSITHKATCSHIVTVNNDGAPVAALRIYAFSYLMVTVQLNKWNRTVAFPIFAARANELLSGRTSGPIAELVIPFRKTVLGAMQRQLDWQGDRIADDPPKPKQDIQTLGGMPEILTIIEIHYTDRADGVHTQTYQVSSYKSGWQTISKIDAMVEWRLSSIRGPAPDKGFAMVLSELTEERENGTAEEWYKSILDASQCPIYSGKQESAWRAALKGVPQERIDQLAAQYVEIPKGDFEMSEHLLRRDGNICEDQP